uniref:Uncharacterized protein n=1 Tax=Anguilla anguilla TaxID=7936 RepID=A0A0E9S122_ANGAN
MEIHFAVQFANRTISCGNPFFSIGRDIVN